MKQILKQINIKVSKKDDISLEPGETELDYYPLNEDVKKQKFNLLNPEKLIRTRIKKNKDI